MLKISKLIFEEFDIANIGYCHWKSNEHLMEGMEGKTDLDVLVDIYKKSECEKILHKLKLLKVKAPLGNHYRHVNDWIGLDYATGALIHLHLHYQLVTGKPFRKEHVLPWGKMALRHRIRDEKTNVYILDPDMEIIILYARIILKMKYEDEKKEQIQIASEYLNEIRYLKRRTVMKRVERFASFMLRESGKEFIKCLYRERFSREEYQKYKELLDNILEKYRIESPRKTLVMHKILKQMIQGKKWMKEKKVPVITGKRPNQQGLVIAFVGTDGAGKSSMSQTVYQWLNWKIEAQQFYLGSGEGLRKPLAYNVYTNKKLPEILRQTAGVVFYLYMSFHIRLTLYKISLYRGQGGIAVLDRFPQTQFRGRNDGPKIRENLKKTIFPKVMLKKIIAIEENNIAKATRHKADIIFKLNITAEEAVRRKPENNLLEMKRKIYSLQQVCFESNEVYDIDAMQNLENEIVEIKRIIWEEMYKKQLL